MKMCDSSEFVCDNGGLLFGISWSKCSQILRDLIFVSTKPSFIVPSKNPVSSMYYAIGFLLMAKCYAIDGFVSAQGLV